MPMSGIENSPRFLVFRKERVGFFDEQCWPMQSTIRTIAAALAFAVGNGRGTAIRVMLRRDLCCAGSSGPEMPPTEDMEERFIRLTDLVPADTTPRSSYF